MFLRDYSTYLLFCFTSLLSVYTFSESSSIQEFSGLPDMAAIQDVREKKSTFFNYLEPMIAQVNQRIEGERAWLHVVERQIQLGTELKRWQTLYLEELGQYYKVDEEVGSKAFFNQMFNRVDVLPASLVLAQAANESAWGTSRFAVDGRNLFGQWCFTKGCGLVPQGRDDSESHEVRVFDTVYDSINAYFRNINTHWQYVQLRTIRKELRYLNQRLDSHYLAWGLEGYSIRGVHYIRELIDMMQYNQLVRYDEPAFYAQLNIRVNDDALK
ncbi:glucosaminidase domain-containing protein [Reinekea marina]|uniref:Glucosaminidase domain-containing protein n=1 Tax=Reinekea marina TaxID=1310421 RepID=A0ABV7WRR4_9GAMM|nr:glucosaminidase domain-containing protein [Reinekea marina]MDN3648712.1 glucosaminidase domain-containing protein [Reinekea marina]